MIAPARNPAATGQRKSTRHTTNPTAEAATMYLRIRFSTPAKNSSAAEEVGSSIVMGTHQCTAQNAPELWTTRNYRNRGACDGYSFRGLTIRIIWTNPKTEPTMTPAINSQWVCSQWSSSLPISNPTTTAAGMMKAISESGAQRIAAL